MIKRIWSVTYHVSDLKKSIDFYEKTLGLNKKYEYSTYAGFECGGVEIGLSPKKEGKTIGETLVVDFLVDNIDEACRTLKKKGVIFVKDLHEEPWGGRHATFIDPDGHFLEVLQVSWEKYFNSATKGFKKT